MKNVGVERRRMMLKSMIPDDYSGVRHLVTLSLLTLAPIPILAYLLSTADDIPTFAWGAVPFAILFGNFIEYIVHRWPMHRAFNVAFMRRMYKRHSGIHHVMFQYDDMEVDDARDWHHVMMTPGPVIMFVIVIMAIAYCCAVILDDVAFSSIMGITLSLYFFAEELLHLSFHLGTTWRCDAWYAKLLRRLAEHHHIHHDTRVMREVNFNIVLPIFDVVFGTYVKDRNITRKATMQ